MVNELLKYLIGSVIIVGLVSSGVFVSGTPTTQSDVAFSSTSEASGIPSVGAVNNIQLRSSLGDKVEFSGAPDSEVRTNQSVAVDETWALCTYATAAPAVVNNNEQRAVAGAAGGSLYYDGVADEWVVWDYNESEQAAYEASVAAPNPTGQTLLCGSNNGTHLRVTRNSTVGTPSLASGSTTAGSPPSANWDGTLEETRVYDSRLNSNQRSEFLADKGLTVTGKVPASRLTYDVRSRPSSGLFNFGSGGVNDTLDAYFLGAQADATNISYVDGASAPTISAPADVEFSNDNQTVTLSSGSQLQTGDVAYLDWDTQDGGLAQTLINIGIGLGLLALVAIPLVGRLE